MLILLLSFGYVSVVDSSTEQRGFATQIVVGSQILSFPLFHKADLHSCTLSRKKCSFCCSFTE